MAPEVNTFTADGLKEHFPDLHVDDYRYESQSIDRTRLILFVGYACLFVVGMMSNGYVACVLTNILRLKSAETPAAIRVFVLALCVCDIWVLAFLPLLLLDLIYNRWAAPPWPLLCQLYLCSESVNKFCGPFLLASLSAFCYLKICRPHSNSFHLGPENSLAKISCSFLRRGIIIPLIVVFICAALAFSLVSPVYIYGDLYYVVLHNGSDVRLIIPKCAFHPPDNVLTIFTISTFLFGYVLTAAAFTIFYVAIVRRVRSQPALAGLLRELNQQSSIQATSRPRRMERATRTCVGLIVFYLACWSPYWAMNLFRYFSTPDEDSFSPLSDAEVTIGYLVHLLPYINCAGYPILHAVLNRNIRRDRRRLKDRRTRLRLAQLSVDCDRSRSVCNIRQSDVDN